MNDERDGVRPGVAAVLALVGYTALAIAALGVLSLVRGEEVIDSPGIGQIPGIAGMTLSILAVAGALIGGTRRRPASYLTALVAAVAAFLGYTAGVWLGGVFSGADPARATAAAGTFATSWFAAAVAGAGAVAGWTAVALVRTRAQRPRWPWEGDEDE